MKHALSIIHNMSMRESNVSKLRDAGMIEYLKPYLKSPNDMYAMNALASLAGKFLKKKKFPVLYNGPFPAPSAQILKLSIIY